MTIYNETGVPRRGAALRRLSAMGGDEYWLAMQCPA
jgi:hypothetical protein